ncbi:MAG: nuclear transport factor 2 family protein [Ghiorsea sp.]|nr:nuclear transport factor 2 family protein [Ghiorsea sp.]
MIRFIFIALVLITSSCTEKPSQSIQKLLEARNTCISQQNIEQYTALLHPSYLNHGGQQKVEQMAQVFHRFEKVKMNSRDQEVRIIDDNHAICEQTYILKVFADGEWREIVQREQLTFTNTDGTWQISGGL